MSAPIFTPIFTYAGTGADVSPLPSGQWTSIGINGPGGLPDYDQLQVLNAQITTTVEVQDDGQATAVATLPDDQYCSFQLKALNGALTAAQLYLRSSDYFETCYVLFVTGPFGADAGTYGIFCLDDSGGNEPYNWVVQNSITLSVDDIITFAIAGSATGSGKLYMYQNGNLIFQGALNLNPDAALMNAGGLAGLQLDTSNTPPAASDVGVINYAAGSFVPGSGGSTSNGMEAGYGTDISASSEITTNPAAEANSARTVIMGTNRGSRFIG